MRARLFWPPDEGRQSRLNLADRPLHPGPHSSPGSMEVTLVALGEKGFEVELPQGVSGPVWGISADPTVSPMGHGSVPAGDLTSPGEYNQLAPRATLRVAFESQKKFDFSVVAMPSVSAHIPEQSAETRRVYLATDDREAMHDLLTLIRKEQHITLCATTDVEAKDRDRGLEHVYLVPCTLPEISWDEISIKREFLGRTFSAPLCITGMTGGLEKGATINRNLAVVAEKLGLPMGVGSQRIALEHPEHAAIFNVKKDAPGVFLIGNLGIAQLVGVSVDKACDQARKAVDMIEADALAIHANVLQEAVQVEGDRHFRGVYSCLEALIPKLGVPVILKEVGVGVDLETARRLMDLGVAAIDVGGKGGTSWSYIEGLRSQNPHTRQLGQTFRDFGIPTGVALTLIDRERRRRQSSVALVATGGIRNGMQVAQCVGLGADLCGIGLPLLKAALVGAEAVQETLEALIHGLKTTMLVTASRNLDQLKTRVRLGRPLVEELSCWTLSDGFSESHIHLDRTMPQEGY